jgi:hypothetical protein
MSLFRLEADLNAGCPTPDQDQVIILIPAHQVKRFVLQLAAAAMQPCPGNAEAFQLCLAGKLTRHVQEWRRVDGADLASKELEAQDEPDTGEDFDY